MVSGDSDSDESINRTILELKQILLESIPNLTEAINRTILELKQSQTDAQKIANSLLIEPFWN